MIFVNKIFNIGEKKAEKNERLCFRTHKFFTLFFA
jgi:hypothetical protein